MAWGVYPRLAGGAVPPCGNRTQCARHTPAGDCSPGGTFNANSVGTRPARSVPALPHCLDRLTSRQIDRLVAEISRMILDGFDVS
jgi:hypothetical protein